MNANRMRVIAAVFGEEEQKAREALDRLKAAGVPRAWLAVSREQSAKLPPEAAQLAGTLLRGERMIVAIIPPGRVESSVERLGSAGAPAVFVLPSILSEPGVDRPAPLSGETPCGAVRRLAERHGLPAASEQRPALFSQLEIHEAQLELVRSDILEAARLDHVLTPAADWLVDNGYLFQAHIAEVRAYLPKRYYRILPAATGGNREFPRTYELASELACHLDFVLTKEAVVEAIGAYQASHLLTMAELWGFPQMLRLAVIEGLARIGGAVHRSQQLREISYFWANRLIRAARGEEAEALPRILAEMSALPYVCDPPFITSLSEQLRDEPAVSVAYQRQMQACAPEPIGEIIRREHHEETADRVSIANAVSSLLQLARMDFRPIFESACEVERLLRLDPAAVYAHSDFFTRDRCRHAVEQIARTGPLDEFEVARRCVKLAAAGAAGIETHVGYYLLGDGRSRMEAECSSRPPAGARFLRFLRRRATPVYLSAVFVITAGFLAVLGVLATTSGTTGSGVLAALAVLAALPLSELAIQIVNALIFRFFPPDELPRLSLDDGIPAESAALVVVPVMLTGAEAIRKEAGKLEVRYLGNTEPHLYFALFPDLVDADSPSLPEDAALLEVASEAIADLNRRHGPGRFFLFHREREWSESEQHWMGRERKRGKIEELNAMLLGEPSGVIASGIPPEPIRYLITLDADTQLPPVTARRMVATLSHPLNQLQLTPDGRNRARGYAIVQPRISIALPGATTTRFTRIFADASGTDPYCQSVSDAYQDLFREGIFLGKAILDLNAFHAILHDRFPPETLLSHDLIEGAHVGVASASGIELFENLPADYSSYSRRQHRWIRGDWQIAEWVFRRVPDSSGVRHPNPLPLISRWRILDNLRRSLVAPATICLLLWGWFGSNAPGLWTFLVAAALTMPALAPLSERLLLLIAGATHNQRGAWEDVQRLAITLALLPHQAWVSLDAIARVFYRRLVTRRRLLEWQTADQADRQASRHRQRTVAECAAISVAALIAMIGLQGRGEFWGAAFFLVPWVLSPAVVLWLGPKTPPPHRDFDDGETAFLARTARLTWRFFDDLVGPEDHWLPPDNTQLALRIEVAHRTSPTNIGLWLSSVLAAHDFGFTTTDDLVARCSETVETLSQMERYEGHWLNWYDTRSLTPLNPRYVSTVDSGNLLASFWVLEQGLNEIEQEPVLGPACLKGLGATVRVLDDAFGGDHSVDLPVSSLLRLFESPATGHEISDRLMLAAEPLRRLTATRRWQDVASGGEVDYWIGKLDSQLAGWRQCRQRYLSWLETLAAAPDPFLRSIHPELATARRKALLEIPSISGLARGEHQPLRRVLDLAAAADQPRQKAWIEQLSTEFGASCEAARQTQQRIESLRERLRSMSDSIDMGFLYDARRRLLGIGYHVGGPVEFVSHYDLLASECRLASLAAIAKGDIPLEHWHALGRPYMSEPEGQMLLSWNGTMFEFLMPMIYTRAFENSFLASACELAVQEQISYAAQKGIPWGISEAAYSAIDANRTYQYRAFGVPSLGLKEGLENDLVVSPYSSLLALQISPKDAVANLESLALEGMSGPMGFYESLDYTREKTRRGSRGVIVYAYMAHHQGMALLAIDNALNGGRMQARFHADRRVQAFESLLFERVPSQRSQLRRTLAEPSPVRIPSEPAAEPRSWQEDSALPRVNLLGNGSYTLVVTSSGSGFSRWKQFNLTSWNADTTQDRMGAYFYIRDEKSGALWSATHQPVAGGTGTFECNFSADRAEFVRRASGIETITSICVSPEADAEVRRLTFTNHGVRTRSLEITSYAELALAPHAAERAHPVFSKLFVETEVLPGGRALIAHRRPREPGEPGIWAGHMIVEQQESGPAQYETNRMAFLGRGRSVENPIAFTGELTGSNGTVLDPVFSLRRRFTLAPRAQVEIAFVTIAAESREALLALIDRFSRHDAINRSFEAAWTQAQLEFRHLGIKSSAAHRYQEMLGPLVFPYGGMRPSGDRLAANRLGQSGLWAHGISGDLPILAVTVADGRGISLAREVLLAHAYWRMRGFTVDVAILNQEPYSYDQPVRDQLVRLVEAHRGHPGLQPGGVFVLDWHSLTEESRVLLLSAAHVVLAGGRGNLTQQLAALPDAGAAAAPPLAVNLVRAPAASSPLPFLELPYFNGFGGFSPDGREYAIYLKDRETTPLPWSNVIASPHFGTVVSESGLGFTWFGNSQSNRLTPWRNDPVCDPQSEILYIRDEESGEAWTPTALPIRETTAYRARHGQGYTCYEHNSHGIRQELAVFVPLDGSGGGDPVKVLILRLHNEDSRPRSLSVTWYVEWVLGISREESQRHVRTGFDVDSATLVARNVWQTSFGSRSAFLAMHPLPQSWTGDRTAFLGRNGSHAKPAALQLARLDARVGSGLDPAGALQTRVQLQPGETATVICLLGQGASVEEVRALAARYRDPGEASAALERTKEWWDRQVGQLQVKLPVLSVQHLLNRWLPYQTLCCRFWARSAFYQSGGAFGFRDQLQDSMALVYWAPDITRRHLLTAAARQFPAGDVQHWWHADTGAGPRTRCSDDMLWLPYATAHYVEVTGDESVLHERVPFIDGPDLEPGQTEHLFVPEEDAGPSASLFNHCIRALERGHNLGEHGLPLFGNGDWNDGMNRVGAEGRGESVWMAWFLAATLRVFAPLAARIQNPAAALEMERRAKQLVANVDAHCWDGEWYLRGFFDDGSTLGSHLNEEARIDSIAQSWAVLAGGGDPRRARTAIDSAMEHLVREDPRQVLLFTPGFDHSTPHPGYIMGYPPGIRENGGQYTHGSLWLPLALARMGRGAEAGNLLQLMNPVEASRDPASALRYAGEPYVCPADVYASSSHAGRCGWTWYTGSASWMYRIWIEAIIGFRLRGDELVIEPALPAGWNDLEVTFRHGEASYTIRVTAMPEASEPEIRMDGNLLGPSGPIRLVRSPSSHEIVVSLPAGQPLPSAVDAVPLAG